MLDSTLLENLQCNYAVPVWILSPSSISMPSLKQHFIWKMGSDWGIASSRFTV